MEHTTDRELAIELVALMRLLDGLDSASHHCACGRLYRISITQKLQTLLAKVRPEIYRRAETITEEEQEPNTGRFSLLEID